MVCDYCTLQNPASGEVAVAELPEEWANWAVQGGKKLVHSVTDEISKHDPLSPLVTVQDCWPLL